MQIYGVAQKTGHLRSGAMAEIHSARFGADANAHAAVRVFRPPAGFKASDQARAAARFLESAWDQAEAAQQTDAGWAPVHDFGQQDGTAYLVTDAYEASLDDLIAPGRHTAARLLREVVLQVVATLESAERLLGRAHGNLKPSNILVDYEPGDASGLARLGLCDPAPGSTLGRRAGKHRDRQDLGRLIVSLVTGVPSTEAGAWPVPAGPEWAQLGNVGEGWRTLAGDLLNPDQADHPMEWDEVHRRAGLLMAPVAKKPKWPWAVAAAVVLIAAGLTTYVFLPHNNTPPATFDELVHLARESTDWAGTVQGQLADTSDIYQIHQAFVQETPEVAAALQGRLFGDTFYPMQPNALLEKEHNFYLDLVSAVDRHATDPTPATQQRIDDTVAFLETNRTAARRAKAALDAALAAREDLEAYIQQPDSGFTGQSERPTDADRLMEGYITYAHSAFDNESRHVLDAIMQLRAAGDLLQQIETARQLARERNSFSDPFITTMCEELKAKFAAIAAHNSNDTPNHPALVNLGKRALRIQEIVTTVSDPDRVHYDSFKALHADLYDTAASALALPGWETAALQPGLAHVPQDTPDPRLALNASDRIDEMQDLIAQLHNELGDDENAEDRQADLSTLAQEIQSLEDTYAWTNGNRERIEKDATQFAMQLNDLESRIGIDIQNASRDIEVEIPLLASITLKDMATDNAGHYFNVLEGHTFSESPAMERAWKHLRDQIIKDVLESQSKPVVLQKKVQEAVLALREIDNGLSAGLLGQMLADNQVEIILWSREDTLARFNQKREDAIDQLAPGLGEAITSGASGSFRHGSGIVPGFDTAWDDLNKWTERASDVLQGYRDLNTYFASCHIPSDRVDRGPGGIGQVDLLTMLRDQQQRAEAVELTADLADTDQRFNLLVNLYAPPSELNAKKSDILLAIDAPPGDNLSQVLQQAAQDGAQNTAVRVAATLAAISLYTPTDIEQLTQLLRLREGYVEIITPVGPDRLKAVQDRFDARASIAWQRSFNSTTNAQDAESLLALSSTAEALNMHGELDPAAEMIGVALNQLTPISKANIYLDRYQDRVTELNDQALQEQAADDAAETLAQELHDHLAPYRNDKRIARVYDRLDTAIVRHREGGAQHPEDAGLGPKVEWLEALGITVTQIDPDTKKEIDADSGSLAEQRMYRFQLGGDPVSIDMAFRLVEPSEHDELNSDAPPAYLSTSEIPVGFFIDVLNTIPQSQEGFVNAANLDLLTNNEKMKLSPLWIPTERPLGIERVPWEDDPEDIVRGAEAPWISHLSPLDAFKENAAAPGIDERVESNHPMQAINVSGATYFANLLGCRLPTRDEWEAAVLDSGGLMACLGKANVRDATWQKQQDYLLERFPRDRLPAGNTDIIWTSKNSYTEVCLSSPEGENALEGANNPDGYVWPRAVTMNSDEFTDLVGNVAEWVVNDAGDLDDRGMPLPVTRPDAAKFGEQQEFQWDEWKNRNFLIIGGSALSCSSTCSHNQPVLVSEKYNQGILPPASLRYRGFPDVGFRLAFTVSQPRLIVTLTSMLRNNFIAPNVPE